MTTLKITRDNLNSVMEFDHVIRVNADGTISDEPGVWTPDVSVASEDPTSLRSPQISSRDRWELLNGYSGQYSYAGPVMHESEFIGGKMADDILSTPGVYVAVVVTDDDAEDSTFNDAGWAVARLIEVPASWPVKVLTTAVDKAEARDPMTCGECDRSWDDAIITGMTPVPAGRCPFEYFHLA